MPPDRITTPALRAIDAPFANAATANSRPHASVPAQPGARRAAAAPSRCVDTAFALKRLTIDIPEPLHRRIKVACARRGAKMADEIRCLLEERYPDDA